MEPTQIYKNGDRGRGFTVDRLTGIKSATVTCRDCGTVGSLNVKNSLPPPEFLDKKFAQKGWELDPNVCPNCIIKRKNAKAAAKKEQVTMNTKTTGTLSDNPVLKAVSADTMKAQAKMHQLLTTYFDGDAGLYSDGWNDERIAKESGIAITHVTEVRGIAYGDIKEPEEITLLRNDIRSLHELINETLITAQKEVNALNNRVAEITKKLGIK